MMPWMLLALLWLAATWSHPVHARTLVLDGALSSSFHVKDTALVGVTGGIEEFSYHLVPPPQVTTKTSRQLIANYRYVATPPPTTVQEKTDPYGNRYLVLT